MLVSYPRSGNTWMRFVLAALIRPDEDASFLSIKSVVPDVYEATHRELRRLPRPRVIKSHEPYTAGYRRALYLVRDPRDVAVSYYHLQLRDRDIGPETSIEAFVERFVEGRVGAFGSWDAHVDGWLAARNSGAAVLVVRYEDLLADAATWFGAAAAFARLPHHPSALAAALGASDAAALRRKEEKYLRSEAAPEGIDRSRRFVRTATSGRYRDELPEVSQRLIEAAWGSLLRRLEYSDA